MNKRGLLKPALIILIVVIIILVIVIFFFLKHKVDDLSGAEQEINELERENLGVDESPGIIRSSEFSESNNLKAIVDK